MRSLVIIAAFILMQGLAIGKVYVGPTFFKPNDAIVIKQIAASSLDFKPGDTVIVRGMYRLNSRPAAKIGLYVTRKDRVAFKRNPQQMKLVTSGRGHFQLKIVIPASGYLHLGFYLGDQGQSFGTTYFGSKRQMQEIANWDLSHYMDR